MGSSEVGCKIDPKTFASVASSGDISMSVGDSKLFSRSRSLCVPRNGDVLTLGLGEDKGSSTLTPDPKGDFVNGDFVGVAAAEFVRERGGVVYLVREGMVHKCLVMAENIFNNKRFTPFIIFWFITRCFTPEIRGC